MACVDFDDPLQDVYRSIGARLGEESHGEQEGCIRIPRRLAQDLLAQRLRSLRIAAAQPLLGFSQLPSQSMGHGTGANADDMAVMIATAPTSEQRVRAREIGQPRC
jgi:hypothetical protein